MFVSRRTLIATEFINLEFEKPRRYFPNFSRPTNWTAAAVLIFSLAQVDQRVFEGDLCGIQPTVSELLGVDIFTPNKNCQRRRFTRSAQMLPLRMREPARARSQAHT